MLKRIRIAKPHPQAEQEEYYQPDNSVQEGHAELDRATQDVLDDIDEALKDNDDFLYEEYRYAGSLVLPRK